MVQVQFQAENDPAYNSRRLQKVEFYPVPFVSGVVFPIDYVKVSISLRVDHCLPIIADETQPRK